MKEVQYPDVGRSMMTTVIEVVITRRGFEDMVGAP
jgi:hypothetical protein